MQNLQYYAQETPCDKLIYIVFKEGKSNNILMVH